jgi:hypothetical protein
MPGSWAVSINTIKTFLWAVAEKAPVLADVGAFGAVLGRGVARLTADVAADIFRGTAALVCRMRQDVTASALFKRDKTSGEMHS